MKEFKNIIINTDLKELRKGLKEDSFFILKEKKSTQYCEEVMECIDLLTTEKNIEINYQGSEHRIWHANKKSKFIKEFKKFSDDLMKKVFNKVNESVNILAIRNKKLPYNSEENSAYRWHMDSLSKQYKLFLFLSNVDELSGPLELLKGTHRLNYKFKNIMSGQIISLKDFFRKDGRRAYGSINNDWVEKIIEEENLLKNLIVDQGSIVIVNTSSIHRAKPCIKGTRYALTSYYA